MNDDFRELKVRIRKLDTLLTQGGISHIPFAQALSAVQRAERHGDRNRQPTPELMSLLEKAELLGRSVERA
jgi:hypothetical protein